MELRADFEQVFAGGSTISGLAQTAADSALHCETALRSALRATNDANLSPVLAEVAQLAHQAHAHLTQLLSSLGYRTTRAGAAYREVEGGVASTGRE